MLSDQDIAIAHIVLADATRIEDISMWRNHWAEHIDGFMSNDHQGDCTGVAATCMRCVAEEAYAMVPVYRELFALKGDE